MRNLQANSTASSIEISWDPPLNISSIEPPFPLSVVSLRSIPEDSIITYTVEVFNVTGMRTPVISVENITASKFTFLEDNHDPSDKFEFIVTAFNIVVGRGDPSEPVNATFLQGLYLYVIGVKFHMHLHAIWNYYCTKNCPDNTLLHALMFL